ncbi:MAG: chitobiase/beta-hexosaminidase C-terminal domain-containing protein [Steroidobacteraceae bacterium]|jgi:uncharacterized repeat protein (TIGR03806 family)
MMKQSRTLHFGPGNARLRRLLRLVVASALLGAPILPLRAALTTPPSSLSRYGLDARIAAHPYLRMPATAAGNIPRLLSQTGVFKDTRNLVPNDELIPYDLVVPFWSDGADKLRWIAVPDGKIAFSATGEWTFPAGTVFIKTFELPIDAKDPQAMRRLETRLLMVGPANSVYGVVYKWRADNSDADLLPDHLTEHVPIRGADGDMREQTWYYPSRKDCLTCHNARAGGVLGVKTRQLNHDFAYPTGVVDNELRTWSHLGLLDAPLREEDIAGLPRLAPRADTSRSLEDRARSYLDANCSQCHRPGGTVANFDARYDTPLEKQGLINGPVLLDLGIDRPRIIAPHDVWRSIAFKRVNTVDDFHMPPLDRKTIDRSGVELLRQWIDSLPGRPVLDPPVIRPAGGTFGAPVEITLSELEPGADIRYTLDGSVPGPSDMRYDQPFTLSGPAVLRTRAFKEGFTKSITAQEVFVVGK